MKIAVKFFFNLKEIQWETQNTTLSSLVSELANNYELMKTECFDSDRGELYDDCEVFLNGQSHKVLTNGLDTKLKDGDKVEILKFFVISGG